MFKRSLKWMLLGMTTAMVLTAVTVGNSSSAGNIATEKTMAGINVSLDKYATSVLKDTEAEEARTHKQQDVTISSEKTAENKEESITTVETVESTEEKDDTSHLKLNLVYDRLGIAKVDSYLNVRKHPGRNAKIIGKMTKNSGCNIYHIKNGWAKIVSGKVRGYVKASYLMKDQKAEEYAKKIANLRASVNTETLNVRYLPSTDARIYDQISEEDEYDIAKRDLTKSWIKSYAVKHCKKSEFKKLDQDKLYDDLENWVCISIDDERAFVSKDFIKITYNLDRAVKFQKHKTGSTSGSTSEGSGVSGGIVDYAMQFLGNPYVWGGTSLTNGCDCSGFVMRLYEHYGHYLPRTSAAQAAATRTISASEVQPGDLFFYGSGGVSHVGMYIGNGQIIHASCARTGIKISYAYYRTPIKIGRVG